MPRATTNDGYYIVLL